MGKDTRLKDLIKADEIGKIYWCGRGLNQPQKNINFIDINDCKKIISKIDLIMVDLKIEERNQCRDLKELFNVILNSNLKPNLKLIKFDQLNNTEESEEKKIYQGLIENYFEGMLKLKNLKSETVAIN
jgi:hypothetical protein